MYKEDVYVVLSGGAALGYAHIGVLEVLNSKYSIKGIIGTSMGAIIGGLFACGYDAQEILETTKKINFIEFIKINIFGYKNGLLDTDKLLVFFDTLTKKKKIEDLALEFASIAFDVKGNNPGKVPKTMIIDKGSLSKAMLASSNVPFISNPFHYNGYAFVDGGIGYPLPIEFTGFFKKDYKVIAVNVLPDFLKDPELFIQKSDIFYDNKKDGFFVVNALKTSVYNQAYLATNALQNVKPDIYISAYNPKLKPWDFYKAEKFYKSGKKDAENVLSKLTEDKEDIIEEIREKSKNLFKRIRVFMEKNRKYLNP